MSSPRHRALAVLLALAPVLGASGALAAEAPPAEPLPPKTLPRESRPPESPPSEAEVAATLRRIESAALRGTLAPLRTQLEAAARARPREALPALYAAWTDFPSEACWNALRALSAFHPESPWPHVGMGLIYVRWRMPAKAQRAFETALAVAPGFGPALAGEALRLQAEGRLAEAEARLREVLRRGEDPRTRAALGLLLAQVRRTEEARAELARAVADWPDQPEALEVLARLTREAGDVRGAVELGERRLALTPRDADAHRAQAEAWLALGEQERALPLLEQYRELGGVAPTGLWRLVEVARALGREAQEARALEAVLEETPAGAADGARGHAEAAVRLAELAQARGDGAAVDALLARVRTVPSSGDVAVRRVRLLAARGRFREAVEACRTSPEAPGVAEESARLTRALRLPASTAHGSEDDIYRRVSLGLVALYMERLVERPGLKGVLKVRVSVDGAGRAESVTVVHDTLGDPRLAAHAYFAFQQAHYAEAGSAPVFQYVFRPPHGERRE